MGKGIQEISAELENLQLSMEEMKREHEEIFREATEEDDRGGRNGDGDFQGSDKGGRNGEATQNCTGTKRKNRERSQSAGSSPDLRTPAPAVVGVGETATWPRLETFEEIATKLEVAEFW